MAGGEEAKQPVGEYSVESEDEASQLKIDASQLGRLEVKKMTPDGALNGQGNVSDEALG